MGSNIASKLLRSGKASQEALARTARSSSGQTIVDDWLLSKLACPVDKGGLTAFPERGVLACEQSHTYPVIDGIPCMLVADAAPTKQRVFEETIKLLAQSKVETRPSGEERSEGLDWYVQREIRWTAGPVAKLKRYPVPTIELPAGNGALLLDLGCGWGRWTIAAQRRGYLSIGLDPSLDAIRSARRVAEAEGLATRYVVGDARYLPFRSALADCIFSFGTLQHFSAADLDLALEEIARVLKPGGNCKVQMRNAWGLISLHRQICRGFRRPRDFELRYWSPSTLRRRFTTRIGPASISAAGYFSVIAQADDMDLLPPLHRLVLRASVVLRRASVWIPGLMKLADSVYVTAQKRC